MWKSDFPKPRALTAPPFYVYYYNTFEAVLQEENGLFLQFIERVKNYVN